MVVRLPLRVEQLVCLQKKGELIAAFKDFFRKTPNFHRTMVGGSTFRLQVECECQLTTQNRRMYVTSEQELYSEKGSLGSHDRL